MVPTTRNHLAQHHEPSGKNSKPPPSYYSGYYIASQLEAASAAAHGVDALKLQPSRLPRRLAMAGDDNDNAEEEAAAGTRVREPILPQIPKSYLRIRDTSMKVEVVLKYLAEKLGLSQSHQIGI
ncbi:hypothetical protein TRIUR3_21923 [Triticum urartu]|uniref:Uncharacterized protein n=2 Tax=Triticum TaxID=4564 RepID=A0A9R0RYI8_TRITD|nr:hypothetical protein TRIUR3_21923 [Triticum urartu]VAH68203.1 unnamed protein product [Triticum turgidum subsp. durum]